MFLMFLHYFLYFLQKTATAVAYCKRGRGFITVNGRPLALVEPKMLQEKLQEPILLLGKVHFFVVLQILMMTYSENDHTMNLS